MAGGSGGGTGAVWRNLGLARLHGTRSAGSRWQRRGLDRRRCCVVVGAGAGTPIGLICESAGPAARTARPENISKELERRFIGPTNLFISNDNPASH